MALILYCTVCGEGYRYQSGPFPKLCPRGHETPWTGATILDDPKVDYDLSENDKRLLRSFRIQTDDADRVE